MNQIIANMPAAEYHADEGLNASTLKAFAVSAKYGAKRATTPYEPTAAMLLGTAIHECVLLGFGDWVVADCATPAAKAYQNAVAENPDRLVICNGWAKTMREAREAVFNHATAGDHMWVPGRCELSVFWDDPDLGCRCKARFDKLTDDGFAIELKTTSSVQPRELERTIANHRYHMQAAWYLRAMRHGLGITHPRILFVFVETGEPYDVVVSEMPEGDVAQGWAECCRAWDDWREWRETGNAPGVSPGVLPMGLPGWARTEMVAPFPLI